MADERITPWQLVEARNYREAAEMYWQEYEQSRNTVALRGCARSLLYDGRPTEALPRFQALIEATAEQYRPDCDFISLGTCHWYLRRPQQAVAVWRESFTATYTDAAGGATRPAILLYAATRLHDFQLESEALSRLRTFAKKHQQRIRRGPPMTTRQAHEDLVHPGLFAWPGALVPFLLGEISHEELDRATLDNIETLQLRRQCQADFFIGLRALRENDETTFRERMTRSASNPKGALESSEFSLARWEVAASFPSRPFTGEAG